jgi:casein kinase II subunit beta
MEKYKKGEFGKCPRVMCEGQQLLPMGQHDISGTSFIKLYCARCEDLYNPKSTRHASIDGAYFGSSFHNILFQVYPNAVPEKSVARHEPRVFGFRVHAAAALMRWQDNQRMDMQDRLRAQGIDVDFLDDDEGYQDDEEDEEGDQIVD